MFDGAAELFAKKWEQTSNEFIQYFRREWLDANRYWYEGCGKLVQSTNNALESFNRLIKDEQTLRERLDLQPIPRENVRYGAAMVRRIWGRIKCNQQRWAKYRLRDVDARIYIFFLFLRQALKI